MVSLMAGVMAVQAALIYQVEHKTNIAHISGIAAAAMLFIFQGAFTVGFQATVYEIPSVECDAWLIRSIDGFTPPKSSHYDFDNEDPRFPRVQIGFSTT